MGLVRLAAPGLTVESVLGLRHGPRLEQVDVALSGLVTAQLATGPQEWSRETREAVMSVTTDDFSLTDKEIGASLDLMLVARA